MGIYYKSVAVACSFLAKESESIWNNWGVGGKERYLKAYSSHLPS
jgi:hypothetical protein